MERGADAYWVDVLQAILKADAMKDVKHIDLMASYTCSKRRPGEHGGWSARITRDGSMFTGTHDAFRHWDQEYQLVTDLALLCDALNTVDTSTEQKEAQARVSDYITNHPAIEYAEND